MSLIDISFASGCWLLINHIHFVRNVINQFEIFNSLESWYRAGIVHCIKDYLILFVSYESGSLFYTRIISQYYSHIPKIFV